MKQTVPKQKTRRVKTFLSSLVKALIFLLLGAALFALLQMTVHPFDPAVQKIDATLASLDKTLSSTIITGVSISSLVVIIAVFGISLAGNGVHKRQYIVSFWRGILSSAVFLLSDSFYRFIRTQGKLYYSISLLTFVVGIFILVEIISRWGKVSEERNRRTELLASIAAGLSFAVLVQIGEYLIQQLQRLTGFIK
jgi:hypothetical protein